MTASLSSREQEITSLVSAGLSNKEVARKLELTEGTIKVHLHNIFRKDGERAPAHALMKGRAETQCGSCSRSPRLLRVA